MPTIPNSHAAALLLLTAVALVLFSRPKISLQSSSLAILVILCIGFELFPYSTVGGHVSAHDLFTGFGHEALITVCALMIVGQGLVATGALIPLGRAVARLWKISPSLSLLMTLVFGAVGSAFINNTPIVVLLIPILMNVAQRNSTSVTPTLMPMNFSTLLGGTCTTIGTSTNLLVVGVAADMGLQEFGMFDFVKPGLIAGSVGLLYLWTVVPFMFRGRKSKIETAAERLFTYQLEFPAESRSIGKTVSELREKADNRLRILRVRKAVNNYGGLGVSPFPYTIIEERDRITATGTMEDLKEIEDVLDATAYTRDDAADSDETDEELQLVQIVLMENSRFVNSTLSRTRFADSVDLAIVAIHRAGEPIQTLPEGIGKVKLKAGDVLLAQGPEDAIEELKSIGSLLVLDEKKTLPQSSKGPLAVVIMLAVVAAAALEIVTIATSALCGVLVMLASRCIDWRDVQNALSIPVIMIVVVSLALGLSLTETGATVYIAELFLYFLGDLSPAAVLSGLILLMAIMTNIVSNNAAAVIGTPIAISMAAQLNVSAEAFVLAVLFGANLSFVTPMAYKTNILVMNAGEYTFADFVKVGLPLTIILWIAYSLLLPQMYNF